MHMLRSWDDSGQVLVPIPGCFLICRIINSIRRVMNLQAIRTAIAAEIKQLQSVYDALGFGIKPKRKPLSAKGRAAIRRAQKARWAKVREHEVVPIAKAKRTMSASARRKIAAAQRARWARVKREKKAA
jgi:hypothetical protein